MTTSDPDRDVEAYLAGDSALSRAYRKSRTGEPPPHLDRAVLEAARAATRPRHAWSPFASHWYVPASLAAVLVLVVGIYMFSTERAGTPGLAPQPLPHAGDVATAPQAKREERAGIEEKAEARRRQPAEAPTVAAQAPASAPVGAGLSQEGEAMRLAREPAAPGAASVSQPSPAARAAGVAEVAKRKELAAKSALGVALADVVSVAVSGSPGAYYFNVGVRSAETGCRQYADWWEVVSEDGRLLYRRVLAHSHVDEQPFARDGGPVPIQPSTVVWVRAHMNPGGYGGVAFKGSPQAGFRAMPLAREFAAGLAASAPLPDGCAF